MIRAMSLAGLLPLLALALTVGLFCRRTGSMSEAIVPGGLTWSFAIALGSEALSIWHAISLPYFLACWSLAVTALALAVLWQGRAFPSHGRRGFLGMAGMPAGVAPHGRILLGRVRHALARPRLEDWILLAPLLVIGGATLLIALVSPPNNWDSQTYHLPRIEHWIQNHSFDFYPTAIDRQLMLPGFAETLVLQLRLLSGGDRLDNMVQWLAGAGSVVVAGRIALALGASRRGAALARLTAATLPIGILESTSTQNDLVVTFFLMCTAERLLAWRMSRRMEDAAFMAVATGLALATKGTAYLVGFPLGLWFLVEILPAGRRSALLLATCSLLLLLPNLPSYMRNLSYSRSPVGTIGRVSNNAEYGFGPLIVNGARNLAVNLATTDKELNQKITDAVYRGLAALGLDANAPALSFPSAPEKFRLVPYQTSEDVAGNPAQLLIGVGIRPGGALHQGHAALPAAALRPGDRCRHPCLPHRAPVATLDHAPTAADVRSFGSPRRLPADRQAGASAVEGAVDGIGSLLGSVSGLFCLAGPVAEFDPPARLHPGCGQHLGQIGR